MKNSNAANPFARTLAENSGAKLQLRQKNRAGFPLKVVSKFFIIFMPDILAEMFPAFVQGAAQNEATEIFEESR
jgi:hypothetical protein